MEISRSIENKIVAKLIDIIYVCRVDVPFFKLPFFHNNQLYTVSGENQARLFTHSISREQYIDLTYCSNFEKLKWDFCKTTISEPTRAYLKDIHKNIYERSHDVEKVYDINYFSNAILGNLDSINAGISSLDKSCLGKPFVLCGLDFIKKIEKYANDYKVEKDKYADVYDKSCEYIRKYGVLHMDKENIILYVDEYMEGDEVILGRQSRQYSIGAKFVYMHIYEPVQEFMHCGEGTMPPKIHTRSRHSVIKTGFENKIYYKIKFFEPSKTEEEIEKENFDRRIKQIINS